MVIVAFMVLGVAGIVLFAFALRSNRRLVAEGSHLAPSASTRRLTWVLGVGFALASPFFSYPYGEDGKSWRISGFPMPYAVFDASGADYVGPTTFPFLIANAVFSALLPQGVAWLAVRRRRAGARPPTDEANHPAP